jgi:hypothetical protein
MPTAAYAQQLPHTCFGGPRRRSLQTIRASNVLGGGAAPPPPPPRNVTHTGNGLVSRVGERVLVGNWEILDISKLDNALAMFY